jgi:hypothetical protein
MVAILEIGAFSKTARYSEELSFELNFDHFNSNLSTIGSIGRY